MAATASASAVAIDGGVCSRVTATYSWASLASTPVVNTANRFALLQTTGDERSNNHGNQSSVYDEASDGSVHRNYPPASIKPPDLRPSNLAARIRWLVSWSAQMLYKKAVYCIDNVSTACSVDDIRSLVTGLVFVFFRALWWLIHSGAGMIQMTRVLKFARPIICIPVNDRALLVDATNFPISVYTQSGTSNRRHHASTVICAVVTGFNLMELHRLRQRLRLPSSPAAFDPITVLFMPGRHPRQSA